MKKVEVRAVLVAAFRVVKAEEGMVWDSYPFSIPDPFHCVLYLLINISMFVLSVEHVVASAILDSLCYEFYARLSSCVLSCK